MPAGFLFYNMEYIFELRFFVQILSEPIGEENIYTKKILTRKIFHIVGCFNNYFIIRAKNILQP